MQAALVVEETISRIRERTGTIDSLDLSVLAALNLANQILTQRGADSDGALSERVRSLADLAEAAVASVSTNCR
jgi:cell division protein ZapA (FtsZ GTPase activity inhibitor)